MAKKRKLQIAFAPDFRAIGLFSDQRDYRLCWHLNRHLDTDLRRMPDFSHPPVNAAESTFYPVYHYEDAPLMMRYYLVGNKSSEGPLFGNPKNLDYLLLLKEPSDQFSPANFIRKLRTIPAIKAAVLLDGVLGKGAETFFYDFEMYLQGSG